jgi:hypothetical protein
VLREKGLKSGEDGAPTSPEKLKTLVQNITDQR